MPVEGADELDARTAIVLATNSHVEVYDFLAATRMYQNLESEVSVMFFLRR